MKTLDTLIKIKSRELDGKRAKLGELHKYRENLENTITEIDKKIIEEQNFIKEHPESTPEFLPFYEKSKTAKDLVKLQLSNVDRDIHSMEDTILELFSELKKFEIVKANKIAQHKKELNHHETLMLDEVGLNSHLRKKNEEM